MTFVKSESENSGNPDDPSGGGGAFGDEKYCNIEIKANWKGKTPKRYYLT